MESIKEEFSYKKDNSKISSIALCNTLDFEELVKRKYDLSQFPDEEVQEEYNRVYNTTLSELEPAIVYNYSTKDQYLAQDAKRVIFEFIRNSRELKSIVGRYNIYQVREVTLPDEETLELIVEKNDPWLEYMSEYEIIVPYNFPKKVKYMPIE